jgi:hypothetical protein
MNRMTINFMTLNRMTLNRMTVDRMTKSYDYKLHDFNSNVHNNTNSIIKFIIKLAFYIIFFDFPQDFKITKQDKKILIQFYF